MRKRAELLVVDDNPADIDLTRDALKQSNCQAKIRVAVDGIQALNVLKGKTDAASKHVPDLMILDLNLPGKDGRTVLSEIKNDPMLRTLPVVIFSTSAAKKDVQLCYELGANSYITKPGNLQEFRAAVAAIGRYWFDFTRLPHEEE